LARANSAASKTIALAGPIMLAFGNDVIATWCLVALIIVFIWVALRRSHQLRIVVKNGRVKSHRGITKAHVRRVVDFLERDVALDGNVVVVGDRDNNGVLRLNFRGNIDEGTRQQIRNFLKMVL
jgi:uncharacterized protein DUF3634